MANTQSRRGKKPKPRSNSHRPQSRRLRFEPLEDRRMLAVFMVDNLDDAGPGSLREALLLAQSAAFPGADVITFDPALTATGDATILLTQVGDASNGNSAFLISSEITIEGPLGDHGVAIARDGGAADMRLFLVDSAGSLTLENITLDGGSSSGVLRNNGVANIIRSTVTGADGMFGTALYNDGQMSVQSSTISGNSNAIFSGGGGSTSLAVAHSTITNNTGTGLYNDSGSVSVTHSIIAGNSYSDVIGAVDSGGFNIVGNGSTGSGFVASDQVGTSGSPIDPVLGPLTDNGGPTRIHVPLSGSPALDAGNPAITNPPDFDQRGAGFPRVVGPAIDIGAVEQQEGVAFATTMLQVEEHAPTPITIIRTGDLSSAVSVTVEFVDGSAVGAPGGVGADFDNTPIIVHFGANQASQDVPLPITIDALLEPARTFTLELTAADLSVLGDPRFATVTIVDTQVVVTTAVDEDDGSTDPNLGTGTSLREAIAAANAVAGVKTIVFDPTVFATPQTILLTGGELEVTESLHIVGLGREFIKIDAAQQSRIFNFTATTGDFSLQSISLTGGRTTAAGDAGRGGAIRAATSGTVTLDDVHVYANETTGVGAHGGGISASGVLNISGSTIEGNATRTQGGHGGGAHAVGNLSVSESVIHDNLATRADGGGLFSSISVLVTDSALSSNTATFVPSGSFGIPMGSGHGGAVSVGPSSGSTATGTTIELVRTTVTDNSAVRGAISAHRGDVSLIDSSITGNHALAGTAGISTSWYGSASGGLSTLGGSATVLGSTISGNIVTGQNDVEGTAGAIVTRTAVIVSSTITGNIAIKGNRISGGDTLHVLAGGTISLSLTLRNSIVAGNITVPDGDPVNGAGGRDIVFGNAVLQNNFIGSVGRIVNANPVLPPATGPTTPDANGNFIGSPTVPLNQPPLGLFSDNGGGQWIDGTPILTYLPIEGSVLINGGHPDDVAGVGDVPLYDSRGEPFSRVIGGRIDIGAVEFDRFTLQVDLLQDGLADDVTLRRNGDQIEVFDNNASVVLHSELLSQLTAIEINGAANEDDRLHVDFAFGGFFALQNGIHFSGGTGGTDLLEITGTGTSLGVYRDGPVPGASTIDVTSGAESIAIHSIGVEPQTIRDMLDFQFDGVLTVGSETLTLDLPVFARLGSVTTIGGGQIVAPGGLTLGVGSLLQGAGTVAAPIAAQTGSTISATGDFALGDANAFNGFFSDGVLKTGPHAVTIHDLDRAVLGSLTVVGNAAGPGTLHAPNGLLNADGKTISGYGVVTADLRNQGLVHGEGPDPLDLIELAGTVTGTGSYSGQVAFSGVLSPGASPALITADGDVILTDSNRLLIELGGLEPGLEYDAVDVSGELSVGGVLEISRLNLGNGYQFELGHQFTILEAASLVGEFNTIVGLEIDDELQLEPIFSSTSLVLAVVSAQELLPGDYNQDGTVNAADYTVWRDTGGTAEQFAQWRNNFGATLPTTTLEVASVAESAVDERESEDQAVDGDALTAEVVSARAPAFVRAARSLGVREAPVHFNARFTPTSIDDALLVLLADRSALTRGIATRAAHSTVALADDEMEYETDDGLLTAAVDVAILDW